MAKPQDQTGKCPVCVSDIQNNPNEPTIGDFDYFECPKCGNFRLSRTAISILHSKPLDSLTIAKVSHGIRKTEKNIDTKFVIESALIDGFKNIDLPSLSDQINNLVLWIGDNILPGESLRFELKKISSIVGSANDDGILLLLRTLDKKGILENISTYSDRTGDLTLSFDGWIYYEDLLSGRHDSRKAFMAMQYENSDLDDFVNTHFREAVSQTGFRLERLDDNRVAGLIDARLRVAIRTSRFIIADLTHNNSGVYWEAGYGEGLGKPVIFTCEVQKFRSEKPHFDTNHHLIVLWDKDKPEEFKEDLKSTIRATLPDESILVDE